MARLTVLTVSLVILQLSWGDIVELDKFNADPADYVEVTFDHARSTAATTGVPASPDMNSLKSVSKRQNNFNGQPHIDGQHRFNDTYYHGRIHYSGQSSNVIVVLTYDLRNNRAYRSHLYRSTDYGHTFTNIDQQVDGSMLYQFFLARNDLLIFVHATESRIFYSRDEGATFTAVDLSPNTLDPRTVKYHSSRDGWMLMLAQNASLYVTKNYGSTWLRVADNVRTFQWGDEKWDNDDRIIYFAKRDTGDDQNLFFNLTLNLYASAHPYTTVTEFDTALGDHDGFLIVGRYIFAQRTDNNVIGLYVSDKRQPFKKAMIPTPFAHQRYLVTHINEMQALVIVEHDGGFYNLYLSDESGVYYSLSLRDIVVFISSTQIRVDLELINGVNGTLIANQYVREDPAERASDIRTLITLDNGGFWEGLLPPDEDINGDTVNCEPPSCTLHLHMDTSAFARLGVYSTDSAPGLIVAHGNTGEMLHQNPDLYISRDGGVTWEETLAGSWGVNVADHGGLLVAAQDYHQQQSRVLRYSCDEGYSWRNFTFIDFDFTVFGVITEPGHHTTIVSLYGGPWGTTAVFTWTVVTVDFHDIFLRLCVDNDYYDWQPWDERSESDCILGSTVTIERRKPQVCCLNGHDYDREFDFTICDCTSEDFECDYGYARPSFDLNAPCMRDAAVTLDDPCADGKTKTYMASTGYRKIAGDVCVDGEETLFNPFKAPCCGNTTLPPTPQNPTTGPTTGTSATTPSTSSTPSDTTTSNTPSTASSSTASNASPTDTSPTASDTSPTPPDTAPTTSNATSGTPSGNGDVKPNKSSSDGVSKSVVVVMAVLLVLASLIAAVSLGTCIVFMIKYRGMRLKYFRVVTAGEPDMQSCITNSEREVSPDDIITPAAGDDDDMPLIL